MATRNAFAARGHMPVSFRAGNDGRARSIRILFRVRRLRWVNHWHCVPLRAEALAVGCAARRGGIFPGARVPDKTPHAHINEPCYRLLSGPESNGPHK